jgi:hypothetical protein
VSGQSKIDDIHDFLWFTIPLKFQWRTPTFYSSDFLVCSWEMEVSVQVFSSAGGWFQHTGSIQVHQQLATQSPVLTGYAKLWIIYNWTMAWMVE